MRSAGVTKLYDTLTPEERFRLLLGAQAREDTAEADRLERTCPRKNYSMPDAAYLDRRELAPPLVLAVCLDLTQHLAKLEVAAAFAWGLERLGGMVGDKAAEGAYHAHQQGAGKRRGSADDPALDELLDAAAAGATCALTPLSDGAQELAAYCTAKAREVWDGFSRFCTAELGLPPETVMGALYAPVLARLERHQGALDRAEPDPATVDEYAHTLTEGWRRVLGLASPAAGPADRQEP